MSIITNGSSTNQRAIHIKVGLDRPLGEGETIQLLRNGVSVPVADLQSGDDPDLVLRFNDVVPEALGPVVQLNYKTRWFIEGGDTPVDSAVHVVNLSDPINCAVLGVFEEVIEVVLPTLFLSSASIEHLGGLSSISGGETFFFDPADLDAQDGQIAASVIITDGPIPDGYSASLKVEVPSYSDGQGTAVQYFASGYQPDESPQEFLVSQSQLLGSNPATSLLSGGRPVTITPVLRDSSLVEVVTGNSLSFNIAKVAELVPNWPAGLVPTQLWDVRYNLNYSTPTVFRDWMPVHSIDTTRIRLRPNANDSETVQVAPNVVRFKVNSMRVSGQNTGQTMGFFTDANDNSSGMRLPNTFTIWVNGYPDRNWPFFASDSAADILFGYLGASATQGPFEGIHRWLGNNVYGPERTVLPNANQNATMHTWAVVCTGTSLILYINGQYISEYTFPGGARPGSNGSTTGWLRHFMMLNFQTTADYRLGQFAVFDYAVFESELQTLEQYAIANWYREGM